MAKRCICWLVFCSLWLTGTLGFPQGGPLSRVLPTAERTRFPKLLLVSEARAAAPPVSAEFFLQSIEPDPGMSMLYDFFDIYDPVFAQCKDTGTYLRALTYLAASGDESTLRQRLQRLDDCANLSEAEHARVRSLWRAVGQTTGQTPQTTEQAPAQATAQTTVQTSPDQPISETRQSEPQPERQSETETASGVATGAVSGDVLGPLSEQAPDVALSASAPVSPPVSPDLSGFASQTASSTASSPATPDLGQAEPVRQAGSTPRRPHLRRTSLPVAPSLPLPSRTVPPAVLAARQPVTAATRPLATGPATSTTTSTASRSPAAFEPAVVPAPSGPALETAPVSSPALPPVWHVEADSRVVHRSGDAGTSRLLRLENTLSLGHGNWTLAATALHLDAGGHGDSAFAGTPFRGTRQRSPMTEQTAFMPQIAYDSDELDFALGTTPLGGEVAPLPTLRLSYTVDKRLKLAVFQESVTDSLLAYTGLRDSYSGERMGRVVRTGGRVGFDDTIGEQGFYGAAVTGAWLHGKNVKENTQIRGEVYVGRAFGAFAVGSYSSVDHYKTDLNHYTFGHGGYYSPDLAVSSVLFASWEYTGRYGRIKADVSSGYLFERTRDSALYYGVAAPGDGVYRGERHNRLTVNGGLEGRLTLAEHLTLASTLRVINSGDFTETRGALQLKWEF